MRWLLAGASGFLGSALRERLAREGHEVRRLVRREPAAASEVRWAPDQGQLGADALAGVDVVVNLAGTPVFAGRWTASRREVILSSRVDTTATIARGLAELDGPAPVLLQASGISWYGLDSGPSPYTEDSAPAADFLAQVAVHWEAAAQPAVDAGVRTVFLRTSPVLDHSGGAFWPMRLAWSLGLGATLGDGQQRMPMISLDDYLGVLQWSATNEHAAGPYNLTIPEPTTNAAFSDALAQHLGRPRFLRAPESVIRLALGELSGQLLGDLSVVPERLQADGYRFYYPDLESTLTAALAA